MKKPKGLLEYKSMARAGTKIFEIHKMAFI